MFLFSVSAQKPDTFSVLFISFSFNLILSEIYLSLQTDPEDNDIIITEIYIQNVSRYQLYWIGALFIINGLLLIFGAFLAWETRNITMAALNDSKLIGKSTRLLVFSSTNTVFVLGYFN